MTELGMALSNPLRGARLPGHVGRPMPGVRARIVAGGGRVLCEASDSEVRVLAPEGEAVTGELLVRGPAVFDGYFDNAAATQEAFSEDGWFHTGDTAAFDAEANAFRLLGRTSVDILKTGGFKVSALEVERKLLEHEGIAAAAVVGLKDDVWGQKVAAAVVQRPNEAAVDATALRAWCKSRFPPQEVPAVIQVVPDLPVNAMGKVNKKELTQALLSKSEL